MTEAEQKLKIIIPAEQIEKRVREMARQISDDYRGKTVHVLGVLENGFVFLADLVREMEGPVICQFIKPKYGDRAGDRQEIFFSHDLDIRGQHVLVVEGLVHSGVTADFLMNDLRERGAAGAVATGLLWFSGGWGVFNGVWVGSAEQTKRNLPYLAVG